MGEIIDESKIPAKGKKKDLNKQPDRQSGNRQRGTTPAEPTEEQPVQED
jgi:hypothetical protein